VIADLPGLVRGGERWPAIDGLGGIEALAAGLDGGPTWVFRWDWLLPPDKRCLGAGTIAKARRARGGGVIVGGFNGPH
jgi:hypothetical protein